MLRSFNRLALSVALIAMALVIANCDSGSEGNVSTDAPVNPDDTVSDTIVGADTMKPDTEPGVDTESDKYGDGAADTGPEPGAFG